MSQFEILPEQSLEYSEVFSAFDLLIEYNLNKPIETERITLDYFGKLWEIVRLRPDGTPFMYERYFNNKLAQQEFYPEKQGDGTVKRFHLNGCLSLTGNLKNNRFDGVISYYNEAGQFKFAEIYKKGHLFKGIIKFQYQSVNMEVFTGCCICQKDLDECQNPISLSCNPLHQFCYQCAYMWFLQQKQASCPICRQLIQVQKNLFYDF